MEVAYAIVDAVRSLVAGCEGNDGFSFPLTFPGDATGRRIVVFSI